MDWRQPSVECQRGCHHSLDPALLCSAVRCPAPPPRSLTSQAGLGKTQGLSQLSDCCLTHTHTHILSHSFCHTHTISLSLSFYLTHTRMHAFTHAHKNVCVFTTHTHKQTNKHTSMHLNHAHRCLLTGASRPVGSPLTMASCIGIPLPPQGHLVRVQVSRLTGTQTGPLG